MRANQSSPRRSRRGGLRVGWLVSLALVGGMTGFSELPVAPGTRTSGLVSQGSVSSPLSGPCPWVLASAGHFESPARLAAEVVSRMTLAEKVGVLVLNARHKYENINRGVASLCIPPLTLQDGPDGIAYGANDVTQLPSAIGIAASFNAALAYRYGQVVGAEARSKGIDVVQAPNLNLLREPLSGRAAEGYGEDPTLVSDMGVADIEGIQSSGVLADAKHYTGYNEETARLGLDQRIPQRALEELYLAPFAAAVERAHVASIMCAYGELDGINSCSDPVLYRQLRAWGFTGFVRSDLGSVKSASAAFDAGLDLIKPAWLNEIEQLVRRGAIPLERINGAVESTLAAMFAFGLIAHPRPLSIKADAATPAHAAFATDAAEQSMVLLKNDGVLPLSKSERSVAVIGVDGNSAPVTAGFGSAYAKPSLFSRPLTAIKTVMGHEGTVVSSPGDPATLVLQPIPKSAFVEGSPLPISPKSHVPRKKVEPGTGGVSVLSEPGVTPSIATAERPGSGKHWRTWSATVRPPQSGLYDFSLVDTGDAWLEVDGRTIIASPGLHGRSSWSASINLSRGRLTRIALHWFAIPGNRRPEVGWQDATPLIAAAVRVARRARIAVVFASVKTAEGTDRPNLDLPGSQDALISAVAAVNPRTIVVLNTGGAVLMPWLSHVAAVLEAWYPGEGDGKATAAVLFGRVDPAGRLPITFPAETGQTTVDSKSAYPGVDATVDYLEGLDIGYRYVETHDVEPLFPFGFGLSYTSFSLSDLDLSSSGGAVKVSVEVTNTGRRGGTDVVECYLRYPTSADEPPEQLRGFATVNLAAGATGEVELSLDRPAFAAYLSGRFRTVAGEYTISVGSSSLDLPLTATTVAP